MHVITRKRLVEFAARFADAEEPLDVWYRMMKSQVFRTPAELKAVFGTASFLHNNITVFNIAGNKYRLVATMRYDMGKVFIRRVLTHAEYTALSRQRGL